jgi:hypothetical protein
LEKFRAFLPPGPPGSFAREKRAKASKLTREARKKFVRSLFRLADHLMCIII